MVEGLYSYTSVTEGIRVTVQPMYLDSQSDVFQRKFVFVYFITITNESKELVQLLRRHWFISHGGGKIEEVDGEGVVGKQPAIAPGESHTYNSFCILETLEGFMEGTYMMRKKDGTTFDVTIPRFTLRAMSS